MNLLEDLASQLAGGSAGGNQTLLNSAVELLNSHPGGLTGLVQQFHDKGLGDVVSSWIGNGQNLPISAEQIQSVLSDEQVQQFAQKLGISPDTASGHLAQLLPEIVNHLIPNGEVPQGGSNVVASILQGLLAKRTATA